jgi:hypothetical protein
MRRISRRAGIAAAALAAALALGGGTAAAEVALADGGAPQPGPSIAPAPSAYPTAGSTVWACVTAGGQVAYLEFRPPVPHPCAAPDALWNWSSADLAPAG